MGEINDGGGSARNHWLRIWALRRRVPRARRWAPALFSVLIAMTVALVMFGQPGRAVPTAEAAPPADAIWRPDHTVVVVLENKNRDNVIGDKDAPFLNELAGRGASMTRSYGVTHPSQPNYVAMFYGRQHGVSSNKCRSLHQDNLGAQLLGAGMTFTGFAESLPEVGSTACEAASGDYERKHVPWASSTRLPKATNQPFSAWPKDFTTLPTVAFVIPNMCNDMHDCSVRTGDRWMRKHIDPYARWAMAHNSLLIVTFDENAGGTVNSIATLLVGAGVRPGVYNERLNHYGLLRTIEDMYGLPPLGYAADAKPLRSIWATTTSSPAPTVPTIRPGTPTSPPLTPEPTATRSATPIPTLAETASPSPGAPTTTPSERPKGPKTPAGTAPATTPSSSPTPPARTSMASPTADGGLINGDFEGGMTGWTPVGWVSLVAPEVDGAGKVNARAGGVGVLHGESALHQSFMAGRNSERLTAWWAGDCRDPRSWSAIALRDHTAGTVVWVLDPTCEDDRSWRSVSAPVIPGHTYTVSMVNHDDVMASAGSQTWFDDVSVR